MAIRTSGTTQRPPTSGPLPAPAPNSNPGSINIVNTSIFITGHSVIDGYSEFVLNKNVGSIPNPDGINYVGGALTVDGNLVSNIDGYNLPKGSKNALYSTTGDRKEAGTYFSGGVGIEQDLAVGGLIYGRISSSLTATTSSQLLVLATDANDEYFPAFTNKLLPYKGYPGASNFQDVGSNFLYGDPVSVTQITDRTHITYNPALGRLTLNNLHITSTATSTATNTGSVVVDGGVGIAKDVYVGGGIYPGNTVTSTIGSITATWATSYLENVYTRFLGNKSGNISIAPNNGINFPNTGNGGIVDIYGDIRVRGQNPIGTAPVVTNVLYVTVDGDDTNDGRAQDASRACRTITGALNSPYYQPGTQILVSPGHYLENNPLRLKPYTSVRGSDIRTTFVEPINKTQDLFHLDSGCYLNYMTFINGRSGLLPGQYASGYNRGAYATAFPPLPPGEQITLFHSPYIQNCTNLSGPWLIDGTMFVPDETVQVPLAVGTGSWEANTTTIIVNFTNLPVNGFINAGKLNSSSTQYTGSLQGTTANQGSVTSVNDLLSITSPVLLDGYVVSSTNDYWVYTGATGIELGQSIDTGKQNSGFFNARTLMLANKPFIQAQVISYISQEIVNASGNPSSIWYNFKYDQQLCYRDVGILIENVAYDAAFGGNEKSIEAGKAYWNGVVSIIGTQIEQTVAAINEIATLAKKVVVNSTCTVLAPVANIPVAKQVINTVLTGGNVILDSIDNLFGIITNIIRNGPSVAPTVYNAQGPDAAYISAEILLQANRKFIQESTINYINQNLVGGGPSYLPYNKIKCARDAGIVIDSIAADLLHPSQKFSQTTFAGLEYYAQNGYTGNIPTEITTTTAAIVYLKEIAAKVIQNRTAADDLLVGITRYSTATQDTNHQPATANEVAVLNSEFDIITSILSGNNKGWTDLVTANGSPSNLRSVQNAHALLMANLSYMQQEVYEYIISPTGLNYPAANFNVSTCVRDIGYIVNSVAFDLLHGGNRQAIQSGLSYYNQVGGVSLIPNENTATSQAFSFMGTVINALVTQPTSYIPYQTQILPVTSLPLSNNTVTNLVTKIVNTLTNIIANGPTGYSFTPIGQTTSTAAEVVHAYDIIKKNRSFIVAETLAWIDLTYNTVSDFVYNEVKCSRDTGLIVDAIGMDLLHDSSSDSTFAGLQYWSQNARTGKIDSELTTTTNAINYLKGLALGYVSSGNQATVTKLFSTVTNILVNGVSGITDQVIFGNDTANPSTASDVAALQNATNKAAMVASVVSYVQGTGFTDFTTATCARDVGYIIDSVSFDLAYGGNVQSIKSGVYYWGYSLGTVIPGEIPQTTAAYTYMKSLISNIVTNVQVANPKQVQVTQKFLSNTATVTEVNLLQGKIDNILDIILNGDTIGHPVSKTPQTLALTSNLPKAEYAWQLLQANKTFIQAEVNAYVKFNSSGLTFQYNQELCYRDVGLMVDAVSQDILLGGNQKSVEAGLAYWNQGYNYIANEVTTTTAAISYIANISQSIIANQSVTPPVGTIATQVINNFFAYGSNYMPQQSVARNYNIISSIIANGPNSAPPIYAGGGLFALTGLNGADVKESPTVTYIGTISSTQYLIGLSTSTIGFGNNSTLYFGKTYVYPLQDKQVETLSLEQTGSYSTWDDRKVDKIGGMGGSLVDGAVISDKSPIQSFVYDAFTQLTQGGRGVHITNNGYAQLVSVFTIFASVAVQVDNGGIASIVNSNANFGDLCLVAKGYGKRAFSGTVYNPAFRSYPFSPGKDGLDQYYPNGYWPYKGTVEVFVPDPTNRPHISLVMEVIPPDHYKGEYNSPELAAHGIVLEGFLNAQPSTGTLVTGSINLVDLDTTDVYINNNVYVVDQFGYPYDHFDYLHDDFGKPVDVNGKSTSTHYTNPNYGIWYCATGTYVTDINFNSITLNQPLTSGANFSANPNYFTVYFTGNAYYTVQTSVLADNPYKLNQNILGANTDPNYQGPATSQINQHIEVLTHMNAVIDNIIVNATISKSTGNTSTQFKDLSLSGGDGAQSFIDLRFGYVTGIIGADNINGALSVVPSKEITKTGVVPSGAGSAIALIKNNIQFIGDEIYAYTKQQYTNLLNGSTGTVQEIKCKRDVELICQQLIYDLETGGNYNMIYSGLSYWSRPGTYHIVELGEAVTNTALFPDGATVNFYQRSYISASGYVFEYVGAGSNYGALPQVGQADPIQKQETVQLDSGKVFFTSTDQNGDFRIGPSLVISQATGVISGRTFTESLFANMTPFILAIETL